MKQFDILKKRYSRKRLNWKKSSASGAGSSDVSSATQEFEKYAFLAWLNPFIQLRKTKSNFADDDSEQNSNTPNDELPDAFDDDLGEMYDESNDDEFVESMQRKVDNTEPKKYPGKVGNKKTSKSK